MTDRLLLYPNIGAEEPRPAGRAAPEIRFLPPLWRMLYPDEAGAREAMPADAPRAAPVLGRFDTVAIPGLEGHRGLVPWLSDVAAEREARERGLAYSAPPADVVRAVHDKAFASRFAAERGLLPQFLADTQEVLEPDAFLNAEDAARDIERRVAGWPSDLRASFTVKPRIGTSGRGRVSGRDGRLGAGARRGLARFVERGGAILEPWLARRLDLSTQLWIDADGSAAVLGTTVQILSTSGIYRGNRGRFRATGPWSGEADHDDALTGAALEVARAAGRRGYRGPCGVDAFVYDHPRYGCGLRAVVELNARFTTGILALGILERARQAALIRRSDVWCFALHAPAGGWHPAGGRPPHRRIPLFERESRGPALLLSPDEAVARHGW